MLDIYQQSLDYINNYNQLRKVNFDIDSIRVEFIKENKIQELKEVGNWKRLTLNNNILHKLKKRLTDDEITNAYQLEKHHIYYYNSKLSNYKIATLVIFGLKQYHKKPPPREIITKVLNVVYGKRSKLKQNIDVCIDLATKPNLKELRKVFCLERYYHRTKNSKTATPTDTYYINNPNILGIEKITIYDKAFKNGLNFPLWRIEAKILIHNHKDIYLPLDDFLTVVKITKVIQ